LLGADILEEVLLEGAEEAVAQHAAELPRMKRKKEKGSMQ
jgi:hypothetical protein